MIRIVICGGSQELAQGLFERARDTLRGRRLNCELSCCTRLETVRGNLAKDPQYYDILILDALDPPCLELAGAVRSKNLTASTQHIEIPSFRLRRRCTGHGRPGGRPAVLLRRAAPVPALFYGQE